MYLCWWEDFFSPLLVFSLRKHTTKETGDRNRNHFAQEQGIIEPRKYKSPCIRKYLHPPTNLVLAYHPRFLIFLYFWKMRNSFLWTFKSCYIISSFFCWWWSSPLLCWKQKSSIFSNSKDLSPVCQGDARLNHCDYRKLQNTKFDIPTKHL